MEHRSQPNRRLRLQRRLRGWSQEDVAAGLHRVAAGLGEPELGVDATMVGRWERGIRKPRPRYVRLLCRLFELPAEQIGVIEEADLAFLSEPGLAATLLAFGSSPVAQALDERPRLTVDPD